MSYIVMMNWYYNLTTCSIINLIVYIVDLVLVLTFELSSLFCHYLLISTMIHLFLKGYHKFFYLQGTQSHLPTHRTIARGKPSVSCPVSQLADGQWSERFVAHWTHIIQSVWSVLSMKKWTTTVNSTKQNFWLRTLTSDVINSLLLDKFRDLL